MLSAHTDPMIQAAIRCKYFVVSTAGRQFVLFNADLFRPPEHVARNNQIGVTELVSLVCEFFRNVHHVANPFWPGPRFVALAFRMRIQQLDIEAAQLTARAQALLQVRARTATALTNVLYAGSDPGTDDEDEEIASGIVPEKPTKSALPKGGF